MDLLGDSWDVTIMRLSPESNASNCGQSGTPDRWPVPPFLWQEQHQKNMEEFGPAGCCSNEETSGGWTRRDTWSCVAASLAWGLVDVGVHCQYGAGMQALATGSLCLCSGNDHQNMVHTVVAEGGAMPSCTSSSSEAVAFASHGHLLCSNPSRIFIGSMLSLLSGRRSFSHPDTSPASKMFCEDLFLSLLARARRGIALFLLP